MKRIRIRTLFAKCKSRIKSTLKKDAVISTLSVAVILVVALYMGVQLSRFFSTSVSTLKTQTMTDTQTLDLKGYIFRDEQVCYAGDGNVADFFVDNGEKIPVGRKIADIYPLSSSQSDREDVQLQLNFLTQRINLLEKGISEAKKLSQASEIFDEIDDAYFSFLSAVQNGNFALADKEEELFLDALNSYMVATGRTEEAQSIVESLKNEKSEYMSANLGKAAESLYNEQSCYFYTEYDGYESIFDYSTVLNMTPKDFAGLVLSQKQEYTGGAIGKMVYGHKWYIVFPVSDEVCDMFLSRASSESPQTKYASIFSINDNTRLTLNFEKAVHSDLEKNSGFAVFSCDRMPESFEFLRAQNVRIELDSCTGYRVPKEAVYEESQKKYVYVLTGNIVEKRRITIIGEGEGYYIVNTREADTLLGTESEIPYLSVNELIITSGNDLYDGKLLS